MLVPIVCFSCGLPLCDKFDIYHELKKQKIEELTKNNSSLENIDCIDILISLDITNDCCKMHLISTVLFNDYY
jgi:DNA-directed RNA polymerase subunit N (RpoN/RPB10)